MEAFELPVKSVTSCSHCLAKLAKLSATPPIKATTAQRPGRLKAKRKLKIQHRQSSSNVNGNKPTLISDLKPDDLPQVDGFCCGHAYLKLSDEKGCACLCPQCIGIRTGCSRWIGDILKSYGGFFFGTRHPLYHFYGGKFFFYFFGGLLL